MQIINLKLSEIHPYEKIPRFSEGAVAAVANSIKESGFLQAIAVDKNLIVRAGHTRLKAAKHLGLTKVPVVIAKKLISEQVLAYRVADNKTGEIAEWYCALTTSVSPLVLNKERVLARRKMLTHVSHIFNREIFLDSE